MKIIHGDQYRPERHWLGSGDDVRKPPLSYEGENFSLFLNICDKIFTVKEGLEVVKELIDFFTNILQVIQGKIKQ